MAEVVISYNITPYILSANLSFPRRFVSEKSLTMDSKANIVIGGAAAIVTASLVYALASKPPKKKKAGRRSIAELVRPNIASLQPYRCARDDYSEGVLLDANENSIGATLGDLPDSRALNRYPCPYQRELKEKIAAYR